ncbi:MAG: hypothetical protein HW407_2294, partial [Bacteroidetes bacterium]|nr:hypothetical protein [Bacteroidota bacterium]
RQGELCWKISFPTRDVGYVSIERFLQGATYILKTTDAGQTWSEKQFSAALVDQQGIGFVSASHGWVGGWGNPTYETTNGGDTWTLSSFGSNVNRFRFLSDTLGYAVGSRVYKYTRIPVDVEEETTPLTLVLEQNYPNPFNPTTTIEFVLPKEQFVLVKILDILGREVDRLFSGKRQRGRSAIEWNASNRPTGVYFVQLETTGSVQTRKLVLLK